MDRIGKDCIGACMALALSDRGRVRTFVAGYAPTDTQYVGEKHALWTPLERVVKEVSGHEQLFALKDTNARLIHSYEAARQKPLAE